MDRKIANTFPFYKSTSRAEKLSHKEFCCAFVLSLLGRFRLRDHDNPYRWMTFSSALISLMVHNTNLLLPSEWLPYYKSTSRTENYSHEEFCCAFVLSMLEKIKDGGDSCFHDISQTSIKQSVPDPPITEVKYKKRLFE